MIIDNKNLLPVVNGVSYIGNPIDNTAMYVSLKVADLINNLNGVTGCIVFAESGIKPAPFIERNNIFYFSSSPQLDYVEYINEIAKKREIEERNRKYTLLPEGYYVGENVLIGKGAYIEPGCIIGHDVKIGSDATILYGAVLKNCIVGNSVLINEYAVIGANGFTMTEKEGIKCRIPSLGKVEIKDNVEIGAHDNISRGSAGNTVIERNAKLDALVHIGHDAYIRENAEITAGTIIGGFVEIQERTFVGINSAVRNRRTIGADCIVGMGSNVTKSFENKQTIVGNPARQLVRNQ